MLVAVISDTHGISKRKELLDKIKGGIRKADILIHLGDYISDIPYIAEDFNGKVYGVKGNGDFKGEYPREQVIEILDKKLLICHGDQYGVGYNLNNLYYKAKELGVDGALFGHTHIPLTENYDNILFFNPGSASVPRGLSKKSIGFLEIKENEDIISYNVNL